MAGRDLTGERFGNLVVLREHDEPYRSPRGIPTRRWVCRCDCGNEVTVLQNALTAQHKGTKSCGCARSKTTRNNAKNLTGRRFGRLTVIEPVTLDKPQFNGNRLGWRARCDCGQEIITTYKSLLSGVRSCGCLVHDRVRAQLEANVIGRYDGTIVSAIRPERKANRNNKTGHKGVYWSNRERCYIAKIGVRNKSITLGRFSTLEDAIIARAAAEEKYFSPIIAEFDNQGKTPKR